MVVQKADTVIQYLVKETDWAEALYTFGCENSSLNNTALKQESIISCTSLRNSYVKKLSTFGEKECVISKISQASLYSKTLI